MKTLRFKGELGSVKRNDVALSPGEVFQATDEEAADLLRRSDVEEVAVQTSAPASDEEEG